MRFLAETESRKSCLCHNMESEDTMEKQNIMFHICVPVYKTEDYLHACVESVFMQTYRNFRIILVDDGSPDRSGEICDQLASADDRISVIHQSNQGQIMARQAAVQLAQSQIRPEEQANHYILFLDADDTLKENALETIAYHIRNTQCDMLIYGIDWFEDGKVIGEFRGKNDPFEGTVTDKALLYRIVLEDMAYNSLCRKAVSVKLTIHKDCSQYRHLRHGEDLLQSLDYLKDSQKTVFIRERLYNYRINPQSVTHTVTADNYCVDTTVRAAVLNFLEEEAVWDPEMYRHYYGYCRYILFQEILEVANFAAPLEKKQCFFDRMNADAYYKKLLSGDGKKQWVLRCFERKKYRTVILFSRIYVWARKIRNKLR